MRTTWHTWMAVLLVALLISGGPAAWAGEEESEAGAGDTPAEKAYRDAWWAETSTGALDEALRRYDEALTLDGPARTKALAHYRRAVVLERIGRTDEAIRALEVLAKSHPDEPDLLRKARERLEEWTAVDLRSSFGEWYRRYQYSPEFQAKIVDIVLGLGRSRLRTGTGDVPSEETELLTIGEAAIPALRAHVFSSNAKLRDWSTSLLLQLGEMPPQPIDTMLPSSTWMHRKGVWPTLFALSEEAKVPIRLGLGTQESPQAILLGAGLDGPTAALDLLRSDRAEEVGPYAKSLIQALTDRPAGKARARHLREVAADEDTPQPIRRHLVKALDERGMVDDATWLAWLRGAPSDVQDRAASAVASGRARDPQAWVAATEAMRSAPAEASQKQRLLARALFQALRDAPPDGDLGRAIRAVERAWPHGKPPLPRGPYRLSGQPEVAGEIAAAEAGAQVRFLEGLIEEGRLEDQVEHALQSWATLTAPGPEKVQTLLGWAESLRHPDVRQWAAHHAGQYVDEVSLDTLLERLPTLEAKGSEYALYGLGRNSGLQTLPWNEDRLTRLLRFTTDAGARSEEISKVAADFYKRFLSSVPRLDQVLEILYREPTLGAEWLLDRVPAELVTERKRVERARQEVRKRWSAWSPEQKLAAVDGAILPVWAAAEPPWGELEGALRSWLRSGDPATLSDEAKSIHARTRKTLLYLLPEFDLDDFRAAWDPNDPEGLAEVHLQLIPKTAAFYEALQALRRQPDPWARKVYFDAFAAAPDDDALARRIALERIEDPDEGNRVSGVRRLGGFYRSEDVPALVAAFDDPSPTVRIEVAKALAQFVTLESTRALWTKLHDPHPRVRDAARASLEEIKKLNELKSYWGPK